MLSKKGVFNSKMQVFGSICGAHRTKTGIKYTTLCTLIRAALLKNILNNWYQNGCHICLFFKSLRRYKCSSLIPFNHVGGCKSVFFVIRCLRTQKKFDSKLQFRFAISKLFSYSLLESIPWIFWILRLLYIWVYGIFTRRASDIKGRCQKPQELWGVALKRKLVGFLPFLTPQPDGPRLSKCFLSAEIFIFVDIVWPLAIKLCRRIVTSRIDSNANIPHNTRD